MMTKKDYERAAKLCVSHFEAARRASDEASNHDMDRRANSLYDSAESVREAFVAFFRGDNDRFDATRFREACGELPMTGEPKARKGRALTIAGLK